MRHRVSDIEPLVSRNRGAWVLGVQVVLIRPEEIVQLEIGPRQGAFTGNERAAWLPGTDGGAA